MKIKQVEPKNQRRTRVAARDGVTYRARVECQLDATLVHAMLSPWLESWSQPPAPTGDDEFVGGPLGCELEFRLSSGGPDHAELLWLLDSLPNGHVAADTLALSGSYTGVRRLHDAFDAPAKRPDTQMFDAACQALGRYEQAMKVEAERVAVARDNLKRQKEGGTKASEAVRQASRPGWLVVLDIGYPDVHGTLRVSALGGDSNRTICGMSQIDARCLTLRV